MNQIPLYPLRFEPIFHYRPWGGRRLHNWLSGPLPGEGPVGEVWLLSDRVDYPSRVLDGALQGMTISQLLDTSPGQLLGKLSGHFTRFPLLLKFLDVKMKLSVQVHPSDAYKDLIPAGESGKTEAWVVLEKGPNALVYAGMKGAITAADLRQAVANGNVPEQLASFIPKLGDVVLVRAGTVHSLSDVVVFEVQENSDVTFRLYDWNQLDPQTGRRRSLQVDQAMACIDFEQGAIDPVAAVAERASLVLRERLVQGEHFGLMRISGQLPFVVGAADMPHVLVCTSGTGRLEYGDRYCSFGAGDVVLVPAAIGACSCVPNGGISVLKITLPEVI